MRFMDIANVAFGIVDGIEHRLCVIGAKCFFVWKNAEVATLERETRPMNGAD
jgi:hypothetical protein